MAYNLGTLAKVDGVGSLLGIGIAYAVGIILAISVAGPVSGAHLSPAITITAMLFKKFPPLKAARYIVAQILGSFIACLVIYAQYHDQIKKLTHGLQAAGVFDIVNYTPQGIAGVFALYAPTGASLKFVFLNEFVCTFLLGIVIWACVDPTNFYVSTSSFATIIALAYGMIIWGYAPVGIAANTARDVGGRMMAVAIWGTKANGGTYAAIAALTNILATILALVVYEAAFTDSSRVVSPERRVHLGAKVAEIEYRNGNISPANSSEKVNHA